ncbi:MAG: hypothetical protein ACI4CY_03015 [Candidatus Gastranaerophilaceae bacterium]
MKEEYGKNVRRWYDKDPVLARSMKTLEHSDDKTQIKVALNIIKIIVEHNIAYSEYSGVEEIIDAVSEGLVNRGKSRWYDIDRTLRAAIAMLEQSDEATQRTIAKEMAKIVVNKIKENDEDPDDGLEDDFDDDDFDPDTEFEEE